MDDLLGSLEQQEWSPERAAISPAEASCEPVAGDPPRPRPKASAPLSPQSIEAHGASALAQGGTKGSDKDEFDWRGDDVILHQQRSIAVYRNPFNGIVIREENPDGPDEDAFIVLRDNDAAQALIAALKREIGGRP